MDACTSRISSQAQGTIHVAFKLIIYVRRQLINNKWWCKLWAEHMWVYDLFFPLFFKHEKQKKWTLGGRPKHADYKFTFDEIPRQWRYSRAMTTSAA